MLPTKRFSLVEGSSKGSDLEAIHSLTLSKCEVLFSNSGKTYSITLSKSHILHERLFQKLCQPTGVGWQSFCAEWQSSCAIWQSYWSNPLVWPDRPTTTPVKFAWGRCGLERFSAISLSQLGDSRIYFGKTAQKLCQKTRFWRKNFVKLQECGLTKLLNKSSGWIHRQRDSLW